MKPRIKISDAEWEVMNVVWEQAPIPAAGVTEALGPKKQWSLATVRTLLRRLVKKGALLQRPEGKRFLYLPRVSRSDGIRQQSESFLDRVLGRTPPSTVLQLVEKADLSREDIQELRRILKQKERDP